MRQRQRQKLLNQDKLYENQSEEEEEEKETDRGDGQRMLSKL